MRDKNLHARIHVGWAPHSGHHVKVCIVGTISLSFQASMTKFLTIYGTSLGCWLASSSRLFLRCLYVLFEEHFSAGVNFQQRLSCHAMLRIGVEMIA
jgi:hypothetical protein